MREKEFYSTGDVAKLLSVSHATVFRAIDRKRLKASTTPGGHYRIRRVDLEAFLQENNIPAAVLEPRPKRVLIVEDNPAVLRLFQRSLEADPLLEVKGTASGYEAGLLTKSFLPDLIVLDIFLEDADGRQVARLIRRDPELRHTRIIAVTGAREASVLEEIRREGFDDLVEKPVDPERFREKVRRLLL